MKHVFWIIFFTCVALFYRTPLAPAQEAQTLLRLSHLPPVEKLESAALERAGLDPQDVDNWQRGIKWAAALPQVQVGWESSFVNQNTTIIQDSLSVTSSGITVGPESNRIDADLGNNRDFEVKAVWALNELLFNRDQLYISREARDLYIIRSKLISELHDHYYELKSLWLAGRMDPSQSKTPLWVLQVERKITQLNSMSGGEFKNLIVNASQ